MPWGTVRTHMNPVHTVMCVSAPCTAHEGPPGRPPVCSSHSLCEEDTPAGGAAYQPSWPCNRPMGDIVSFILLIINCIAKALLKGYSKHFTERDHTSSTTINKISNNVKYTPLRFPVTEPTAWCHRWLRRCSAGRHHSHGSLGQWRHTGAGRQGNQGPWGLLPPRPRHGPPAERTAGQARAEPATQSASPHAGIHLSDHVTTCLSVCLIMWPHVCLSDHVTTCLSVCVRACKSKGEMETLKEFTFPLQRPSLPAFPPSNAITNQACCW